MSNLMSIYLEIYTVAPAPSRDYYGIKVLCDEVLLLYFFMIDNFF